AGSAAALTLGTAACVAGKDTEKLRRLPDLEGVKTEVIIQKSHRFAYDHAVRAVGVKLVEVDSRAEMEKSISGRTALVLFVKSADPKGQVKRAEFVEVSRKPGVQGEIDAEAYTAHA